MKLIISGLLLSLSSILATSWSDFKPGQKINHSNEMMIRIAEIEIDSLYLDAYIALLKEEAAMSVRLEPGVICIFPLFEKEHPTQIRITEIYINKEAYDAHLVTPHFLKYKTTTTEMVKSLRLIEMSAIDLGSMPKIFSKQNQY